jgi:hypothetical protein
MFHGDFHKGCSSGERLPFTSVLWVMVAHVKLSEQRSEALPDGSALRAGSSPVKGAVHVPCGFSH